jgi:hypothetical protein
MPIKDSLIAAKALVYGVAAAKRNRADFVNEDSDRNETLPNSPRRLKPQRRLENKLSIRAGDWMVLIMAFWRGIVGMCRTSIYLCRLHVGFYV